jgi:hypothetical protein
VVDCLLVASPDHLMLQMVQVKSSEGASGPLDTGANGAEPAGCPDDLLRSTAWYPEKLAESKR